MVHNGPKNKVWNARHRQEETVEGERWKRQDQETKAYGRLRDSYHPAGPPPGHYRNTEGCHVKIITVGDSFVKGFLTEEDCTCAPGSIWVPAVVPQDQINKPFNWESYGAQYQDSFEFWPAMQYQLGFNECGFEWDSTGRKYRIFQLKQLKVVMGQSGLAEYSVGADTTIDRTREYYRQAADGTYTIVPPISALAALPTPLTV